MIMKPNTGLTRDFPDILSMRERKLCFKNAFQIAETVL